MSSTPEIKLALNRVYRALGSKKKPGYRDIRLGLERIKNVVPEDQNWQGIHVGGTNGKGSICAFLGGLFRQAGVGYGTYTSPAFPQRHDGVTINNQSVDKSIYEAEAKHVEEKWNRLAAGWRFKHAVDPEGLSPFELETATAFRLFNRMKVPYGIVEVGMGGASDATNVMKQKAVTVISKIGLDHQEYLGNSIEKIAKVKAGIMRTGVPCIVDHTNSPAVMRVLREHARNVGTTIIPSWKAEPLLVTLDNATWHLENYQIQNLLCATLAFRHIFPDKELDLNQLMKRRPFPEGRLQQVKLAPSITGQQERTALLDGAHNMLGVKSLVEHVNKRLRKDDQPVTWVLGMSSSKHKPFESIVQEIVQPQDNLAFAEFKQGPNDPAPVPANFGAELAQSIVTSKDQVYEGQPDIESALRWASEKAGQNGPLVVTGSLYLLRDIFKTGGVEPVYRSGTLSPEREQLYQYTKLAQKGKLDRQDWAAMKRARKQWYTTPLPRPDTPKDEIADEDIDDSATTIRETTEFNVLQQKAASLNREQESHVEMIEILQDELKRAKERGAEADMALIAATEAKIDYLEKKLDSFKRRFDQIILEMREKAVLPQKKFAGYRRLFGPVRKGESPAQSPYTQQTNLRSPVQTPDSSSETTRS